MFEILQLNEISNKIYTVFDNNYNVVKESSAPDAIIVRSYNMHEYEINDGLLAVARAGAGVNNIPIPQLSERGVVVFNTPGANANAVKELTICGLLLASRGIVSGIYWENTLVGKGAEVPKLVEKGKSKFGGVEIAGKTLGVIGLGAIGVKVANAANALDMKVIGFDPYISCEQKSLLNPAIELTGFEEILKKSDYITLHIPLSESTRELVNFSTISKMKDGVILLNMSRAELVNIKDLKDALAQGKIRNYVVDFPTDDSLNVPGIIALPHLGASTEEAEENCAVMAAEQLKNYLENGNIKNSVNFPAITVARTAPYRMTVTYKTCGCVIDKIKSLLDGTDYTLNYAEKKDIGYAIIDSEKNLSDSGEEQSVMEAVSEIENVVSIRII